MKELTLIRYMIALSAAVGMLVPAPQQPRFPIPVDLCTLIPTAEATRLVPGAKRRYTGLHGMGCRWTTRGVGLSLMLRDTLSEDPHTFFREVLNSDHDPSVDTFWTWGEIGMDAQRRIEAGARQLNGVGEEAYSIDLTNYRTKRLERSTIVYRVGNLVLQAGYTALDGRVSEQGLREGVRRAATLTAAALDRLNPPPRGTAPPVRDVPLGCSQLTLAQAVALVPKSFGSAALGEGGCSWGEPGRRYLELSIRLVTKGPAGNSHTQARVLFDAWKVSHAPLAGIGDEATRFLDEEGAAVVVFRQGDLVVQVTLSDEAGTVQKDAKRAARWISRALGRSHG